MREKKAKHERKDEAAATVANDPQALFKGQLSLVRMDGAIEGCEAALKMIEVAFGQVREALGATKANRRALLAEVERLQKAAGADGKTPLQADADPTT